MNKNIVNTDLIKKMEYIQLSTRNRKPLVSVVVTTYQHAGYIRECLDGILSQKTDFPFEVVVGDDGSTDGTREICKEYAAKYPGIIRLFLWDRSITHRAVEDNKDVCFNGPFCIKLALGDYIAFCEGDDYWSSTDKLQKQRDYLEKNKNCAGCSCLASVWYENDKRIKRAKMPLLPLNFTTRDFLLKLKREVRTCTMFIRASALKSEMEKITEYPFYAKDNLWRILVSKHGKFSVMREAMAVYRVHDGGIWSSQTFARNNGRMLFDLEQLRKVVGKKDRRYLDFSIAAAHFRGGESMKTRAKAFARMLASPNILIYYLVRLAVIRL